MTCVFRKKMKLYIFIPFVDSDKMSTYNNVLGNFTSHANDLSDLDDYDEEDSGSEPEPEMGNKYNTNQSSRQIVIDKRSQFVESLFSKSINNISDLPRSLFNLFELLFS